MTKNIFLSRYKNCLEIFKIVLKAILIVLGESKMYSYSSYRSESEF